MATNHPLCNIFTQVIAAAFDVTNGIDASNAIDELLRHHVDDMVSSEAFDAIQTALMNIELQVHQEKDVRMVVFSTVHNNHKLFRHRVGPCEEFTMLIISLKALNQKQTLNNSLYKIRNKFRLSDKEKALFLASPMMDSKNKAEAINVLLNNFYGIKDLSHEEYEDMIKIVLIYANKWCYKEVENSYGGSDMVVLTPGAQKLYERLVNEGIEQGIEQGIDIIAVNMIKEGFSLEDTSRATGLPKAKIAQLCKSK
jgi:hypothetical protein